MSEKRINLTVGLGVFLLSAFVYLRTLSVTVVFWDVGEFCAASYLMQVPHPPGSPLFLLIARIASMVPFFADIAARMHAVSAIGSAAGIFLLYLNGVKIISIFRGAPQGLIDRLAVYGSSAIGALALAFSTTYWDNSIEAEVYGLAMLFVSLILWLALTWREHADGPGNERYLLLIAYLIGLSVGVHLLAVLSVFSVLMIIYFRRVPVNRSSIIRFGLIGLAIFFVIYPGTVQYLPSMLDGEFKGFRSDVLVFVPLVLILAALYAVYRTTLTHQKVLHLAALSFLLIVLGYTTYTGVLIRANVPNIPMNENNPSDLARLTSYVGREQYGETPILSGESWDNGLGDFREKLFPRRYSHEALHSPTRNNYTSDTEFLWRYQIDHMYVRYVLWNFVGAEGDWQNAGVSWKETWGIPFLLALLGAYYHFRRDWKMASVLLMLWIVMGIVLDLYQNQQDPQPRERDYFYVGAYYVMCLWIGIAASGVIDAVRKRRSGAASTPAAAAVLVVLGAAVPLNLCRINWHEHDRSKDYVAWDYAYNLLQSCAKDAILFTNGDNDTFPLWYLQDVEGIRRDVRVANLSLINTPWYINFLKYQEPYGTKRVAISIPDQQIEKIQPAIWKARQVDLPVPKEVLRSFGITDTTASEKMALVDSSVLAGGRMIFTLSGAPFDNENRVLRVQDRLVYDIIRSNQWKRPIYFAVTVSPDARAGLDRYLWMEGGAYRLKPLRSVSYEGAIDPAILEANLMADSIVPSKEPRHGFLYRNLNSRDVYYDENTERMMVNYRIGFLQLAYYAMKTEKNPAKGRAILNRMEYLIPLDVMPPRDWHMGYSIARTFYDVGERAHFMRYADFVEAKCKLSIERNDFNASDPYSNPYVTLLDLYELRRQYGSAADLMRRLQEQYPGDSGIARRIQQYEQLQKSAPVPETTGTAPN